MRFNTKRALLAFVAVFAMSAVAASSAFAAGIPYVEAKPATAIGKTEATLVGTVDADAAETKYHFEYGTSTAYGSSTPEVSAGSGTTFVEESQKIGHLLADKGYDFRIVAKNSYGTADGANEAFTTLGPKVPVAETVGASAIAETSATLNGVVNPNGLETKYYFEYGTTKSYGTKTASTSAGSGTANLDESATISGLKPKTTYYFRVVATSTGGTTDGEGETFYSEVGPEFKPFPTERKFTGTGGESFWTYEGGGSARCSKSTMSGEITGATKIGDVIVKFTGCTWKASSGAECALHSPGAGTEEVVTNALAGELGTIVGGIENHNVALVLTATEKNDLTTLESLCGNGALEGSLAGRLEMSPRKSTTSSLDFPYPAFNEVKMDSSTVVKPKLSWIGASMTLESQDKLKFEEELEL